MGIATCIFACDTLDPTQPGNLVPKTADQDSSIPAINVNGTRLHAEAFGDPADPMVVFLHGGPGADYRNAANVRQLTDDGYYVVFYDQRGSGLSQRHKKSNHSLQLMFDDLAAVIAHYRTSEDQKIFLFGHSWGGMLAAGYINQYPDRISGAIFAEPGGFTWEDVEEYGAESKKIKLFAEATNDVLYTDQFFTAAPDEHEVFDYKLALSSSYSYAPGNDEGIEAASPFWRYGSVVLTALVEIGEEKGFDFTTNLDEYPHNVLFLYGENNKAYGLSFAQKEAAHFPHATIAQVDDTGHEMIYFGWDNVYPLVLNYLNSLN